MRPLRWRRRSRNKTRTSISHAASCSTHRAHSHAGDTRRVLAHHAGRCGDQHRPHHPTEGQRDSATLAAIGGTRRTRPLLAAVHAFLVGAVGVLLGTVLDGVMSWTSTQVNSYSRGYAGWLGEGGVVAVPWFALGLATVAIPTIAAAVAWISVRRALS